MSRAVIIIDMLNEFLRGRSQQRLVPAENVPDLVANVRGLIDRARGARVPVVYVACAHDDGDAIFRAIPAHAMRGTWEAQIVAELAPAYGDEVVEKKTYDGFYETRLDAVLRNRGVGELILAGAQTDCCVHATGQGAVFRGYRVSAVADCMDTANAERQRVGLDRFRSLIGPTLTLDEIVWGA